MFVPNSLAITVAFCFGQKCVNEAFLHSPVPTSTMYQNVFHLDISENIEIKVKVFKVRVQRSFQTPV